MLLLKKNLFILTLVFFSVKSFAQQNGNDSLVNKKKSSPLKPYKFLEYSPGTSLSPEWFGEKHNAEFGVTGFTAMHSNAMNVRFGLAILNNQFIDNSLKNSVSSKLKPMNHFAFDYSFGAFVRFHSNRFLLRKPTLYSVSFNTGQLEQIRFTDDVFNTTFYGNAYYAGATADFSHSREVGYKYSELRLGIQQRVSHAEYGWWEWGIGIRANVVHTGRVVNVKNATLFTEQYGEYLDGAYNYCILFSDSSNHGNAQVDGFGSAADFYFGYTPIVSKIGFQCWINNAGFVFWNKNSLIYSADTSIHFEGLYVDDLFAFNDSSLININGDTILKETGTHISQQQKVIASPVFITASIDFLFAHRVHIYAGVSYKPFPDQWPVIFIQPQFNFINNQNSGNNFYLVPYLFFGGPGSYGAGASAVLNITNRFYLNLGSENVLGLILPDNFNSSTLFVQTSFVF